MRQYKCLVVMVLVMAGLLQGQSQEIGARNGGPGDRLGSAVAHIGDVNGDGVPDVAVGSPDANGGAGAVEILSGADLSVLGTVVGAGNERFGFSVDRAGDLNGDGTPDWVAGSAGNPFGAAPTRVRAYSGVTGQQIWVVTGVGSSANVDIAVSRHVAGQVLGGFPNTGTGLSEVKLINANGSTATTLVQPTLLHGRFGQALGGGGSGPAGQTFAVIGSELHPDNGSNPAFRSGEIRVVNLPSGTVRWTASGDQALAYLGRAVSIIGDVDGDGWDDVLAGAPSPEIFFTDRPGLARVYSGANGSVIATVSGLAPDDTFGSEVARLGDVDGDGVADFAVGAPAGGVQGGGYVRVYSGATRSVIQTLQGPQVGAGFGLALDGFGDRTDGLVDLVIGSPTATTGGFDAGQARLLTFPSLPGSNGDLVMLTRANSPLNRQDVRKVFGGEPSTIRVESPNGTLDGEFLVVAISWFPTGASTGATPGYPDIQVNLFDPAFLILYQDILPAAGWEANLPAEATLGGLSVVFQGAVISSLVPRGYVTTNAHEYQHQNQVEVYVSSQTGSPSNSGTSPTSPLSSINAGYALARSIGSPTSYVPYPKVNVSVGNYNETPFFDAAIDVRGGLDPSTWTRIPGIYSSVQVSNAGARARNITGAATISGFEFSAANGSTPSSSGPYTMNMASIALDARSCSSSLVFDDCVFQSGTGATGPSGVSSSTTGTNGNAGSSGSNGYYTLATNSSPSGGAGGSGAPGSNGGAGGAGGDAECTNWFLGACITAAATAGSSGQTGDGGSGAGGGGGGGSRSVCGIAASGAGGNPGAPGAAGANGAPFATASGRVVSGGDWRPNLASSGGNGSLGKGGGGGGGGGAGECAQQFVSGGSGGGGGEGGSGGGRGIGGVEGGASFAVYLYNASPTFTRCTFSPGRGGNGGRGGSGASGGAGGAGGGGGSGVNVTVAGFGLGSGTGGTGGTGGAGGGGGGGGGANGGPSYCVFRAGASNPPGILTPTSSNVMVPNSGGNGGLGGVQGATGGGAGAQASSGQSGNAGILGN